MISMIKRLSYGLISGSGSSKRGLVGARGFEPPTPASRTRCATRLRYAPIPDCVLKSAADTAGHVLPQRLDT